MSESRKAFDSLLNCWAVAVVAPVVLVDCGHTRYAVIIIIFCDAAPRKTA